MMVDDIIVIDNFLNPDIFSEFKNTIIEKTQWYFTENISSEEHRDPRKYYGFGFTYVNSENPDIYEKTPGSWFLKNLNNKIKEKFNFTTVLRCRSDMTTYRGDDDLILDAHTDLEGKHYTSIFYLTECDAPTIVYNEKIIEYIEENRPDSLTEKKRIYPKENRLLVFDGNHIHTGMCPKNTPYRILINSNFK